MARHYVIQDWSNSATWSGEMIGNRLSESKGHHFLKNGKANVELYAGDEDDKPKSKISIKHRILPQARRVQTLTTQMQDLVADYKAGNMSIEEYSMLLSVVSAKRSRAEDLLAKAMSVKAPFEDDERKPSAAKISTRKATKTSEVSQVEDSKSLLNKALTIAKSDSVYFVCGAIVFVTAIKLFF